ncbi:MAG TPA: glycosyl hydrolase family 28-related protein [Kiritimatiellia bacterium]|nr:glycosyl hydrolase family 28-related protein [Kiritimatiellia bacterium]HOM58491.1 glycosyl hydrolase family 28-related protein [Kiritimatiellia bacterium]HPK37538.1 glycosyl hydrolase family 28-related protein [Kiritimatiellia bacterium]HPW74427.1 glycosyl hydrolase family 28-related protein [Kiritimatiellia bacterium]
MFRVLLAGFCTAASLRAAEPAVVWVSQPVAPGEAVVVYGGPWTNVTGVMLKGPSELTVTPVRATDDCVTFVYPKTWPLAAFDARVVGGNGTAELRVNAPEVWWVQGDAGMRATPGGWLRVFGRCIGYDGKASLTLRDHTGKATTLAAGESGPYALRVDLPQSLQAGTFEITLRNGLDSRAVPVGAVEILAPREPWPERVFDITAYGAVANDFNDDTAAIRAALAALEQAGGGVLYVPRGRFGIQGELSLPPKTLLRGAGMALSQLYWLDEDNPVGALVSGTRDFGIEEIFLAAGNIDQGILVVRPKEGETWINENILLRRVRTRFLHTDTVPHEESFRRLSGGQSFSINGTYVRVIGCDFYSSKGSSGLGGRYLEVRDNRFDGESCGYTGGRFAIFENNNHERQSMSFGNGSRCVYFKGNQLGGIYGNGDRETFTFDGGDMGYIDALQGVGPASVTLKPKPLRRAAERWIDEPLYIAGGRGAGQLRYIRSIAGQEVKLDRPWDILPATNVLAVIAPVRHRLLILENQVRDGNPFAMYGSGAEMVLGGNKMMRNSGLHAHGMWKGVSEPCWFVEFVENELLEGNAVRGPFSFQVPAADGWIGFFDRGIARPYSYPQNRVGIMRRNVLHNNAYLASHGRVKNLLVENNLIRDADRGIVIAESVEDAVLLRNRFERVLRPYAVGGQTRIGAADSLNAGLSAVEAELGSAVPEAWPVYRKEAEALAAMGLPQEEEAKWVSVMLLRAVRALSESLRGRALSPATVASLMGIDLAQKSIWQFTRVAPGNPRKFAVGGPLLPQWGLPAALTGSAGTFEGWTVRVDTPKPLEPGRPVVCDLYLASTAGPLPPFTLPVRYTLAGQGWTLAFEERYGWDQLPIQSFLAAGPFANVSGKAIDTTVHPPEIELDMKASYMTRDGNRPWVPVTPNAKGEVDLSQVFKSNELATAHLVAVVRAARGIRVNVPPGGHNALLFVNGERIGSSARRDAPRCVDLRQGDNLFHLISSHTSGAWPIRLTLTMIDPVRPGDLTVVPTDQIASSPALTASANAVPEGKGLPDSMGVDWKLVVRDDFNRMRLGDQWRGLAVSWMPQGVNILEGAMRPEFGFGSVLFHREVALPVRIEWKVRRDGPDSKWTGVSLAPKGLSYRTFWYTLQGRGYFLSLGWHDAKNNRVLRNTETVVLDEKGPMLEPGVWHHVVAQFVPPHCRMYLDGKQVLAFEDPDFLPGLNEIGLYSNGHAFDDIRIYTGR